MKSQAISVDISIALLGFVAIIIFFIWGWQEVSFSTESYDTTQDMYTLAYFASESLLETTGDPIDWHTFENISLNVVSSIGLSSGNALSQHKVFAFLERNETSYENITDILGISGPHYNLHVQFHFDNGTDSYTNDSLAFGVIDESRSSVVINRFFVLDNISKTTGKMVLTLSGGTSFE